MVSNQMLLLALLLLLFCFVFFFEQFILLDGCFIRRHLFIGYLTHLSVFGLMLVRSLIIIEMQFSCKHFFSNYSVNTK